MLFKKALPTLLLGLALTAGCDSLGLGGDKQNNNDDTQGRHDRISRDDNARNRDRGGYDGSVMKYPSDFDNGIPSGARLIREVDQDGSLSYKTPHDGRLYVYDADNRRVVWSGAMNDGERFSIDTRNNRATVNDQNVLNNNRDLNPDHRYHLYFVQGARDSIDTNTRSSDRNP